MTIADNLGINVEPVSALDINGVIITRSVTLANQVASITLNAASTVDITSLLLLNQSTNAISLVLPSPTNTTAGRRITVANIGSANITVNSSAIDIGLYREFIWTGSVWQNISTSIVLLGSSHTKELNTSITGTASSVVFNISSSGFNTITNIQVTALLSSATVQTAPICSIVAQSLTSITVLVMENNSTAILLGGTVEGLALSSANKTVYLTVKGT